MIGRTRSATQNQVNANTEPSTSTLNTIKSSRIRAAAAKQTHPTLTAAEPAKPRRKAVKRTAAATTAASKTKRKLEPSDDEIVDASLQVKSKRAKITRSAKASVDDALAMPPPAAVPAKKRRGRLAANTTASETHSVAEKVVKAKKPLRAAKKTNKMVTIVEDADESAEEAAAKVARKPAKAKKTAKAAKAAVVARVAELSQDSEATDQDAQDADTPNRRKVAAKRIVNMNAAMNATATTSVEPVDDEDRDSGILADEPLAVEEAAAAETAIVDIDEDSVVRPQKLRDSQMASLTAAEAAVTPKVRSSIAHDDSVIFVENEPMEVINISDLSSGCVSPEYSFAMLQSDDETDDEDDPDAQKNRPKPPEWSLRDNRMPLIEAQSAISHTYLDKFFSVDDDIDLRAIFPDIEQSALKRRSSAIWTTPPRYSLMPKY